jgi:hypothetical protein
MDEELLADSMVTLAVMISTGYVAYSLRLFRIQATSVIAMVNCIFFAVYLLPIALDLLLRDPDYGHLDGYNDSTSHHPTRIFSAFALCMAPVIWTEFATYGIRFRTRHSNKTRREATFTLWSKRLLLTTLAVLPLLILPFAPNPAIYTTYGPLLAKVGRNQIEELTFHAYLNQAVLYSVLSCFALLITVLRSPDKLKPIWVGLLIFLLAIDCFLYGKRAVVALAFSGLVFCLWYTEALRKTFFIPLLACASIFIAVYSHWYQIEFGRSRVSTFDEFYDSFRLEFSRDHAHKFVIYNAIFDRSDTEILSYPGESLVIYATLPVPRSLWEEKPISYAMSLTCAALGVERHYLGWGVTSSVLDESIANFGVAGFLIGPLVLGMILRTSMKYDLAVFRMVTTVLCLMLMMVHLSSCLPMLLGWLVILFKDRSRRIQLPPVRA